MHRKYFWFLLCFVFLSIVCQVSSFFFVSQLNSNLISKCKVIMNWRFCSFNRISNIIDINELRLAAVSFKRFFFFFRIRIHIPFIYKVLIYILMPSKSICSVGFKVKINLFFKYIGRNHNTAIFRKTNQKKKMFRRNYVLPLNILKELTK